MSKMVKEMIMKAYREKFAGVGDAVLVDIRGVTANDNKTIRGGLAAKQIRITVVRNNLAKKVFGDTTLAPLNELIEGPSAVVYGADSVVTVARELIGLAKKNEKLQLKGAVMEGTLYGPKDVERLSKFPTRQEAQAQVIQLLLGPAGQLIGAITSAGSQVVSILQAVVEKLEKNEEIKKVA